MTPFSIPHICFYYSHCVLLLFHRTASYIDTQEVVYTSEMYSNALSVRLGDCPLHINQKIEGLDNFETSILGF